MKRFAVTILLAAAGVASNAADPYVGYIYPAGIQAGTTNRFVVGGQNLWGLKSLLFETGSIHVLDIERVPGFPVPTGMQRKHLKNWLDGIAEGRMAEPPPPDDPHINEWRSNVWWTALDKLDAGKIAIVEHDLYTPKNALQATPSLRQMVLVTMAADSDAAPGTHRFSAWNRSGISAPRPFSVSSSPHCAEPAYVPPHRKQPEAPFCDVGEEGVILDGQIMPGSTDSFVLRLREGKRYDFRVTARELQPYIGDAVPGFFNPVVTLKAPSGEVVASADDDARFRPDPAFSFTPASTGDYTMEIHDVLYRGRADFVYAVAVNAGVPCESAWPPPDGAVSRPGATSSKAFTIDSPGPRTLKVTARRRGSPLDAVLTLRKGSGGPVLAQWDDVTNSVFVGTVPQAECDPEGIYDFKEPGIYTAEITDRTGHGGPDYVWWLSVRDPEPEFEVYSTRSTLPLHTWPGLGIDFQVVRKNGFAGDVTIEFPKSVRPSSATATSGVDSVHATLYYTGRKPAEIQPLDLYARASIGGRTVRVPVMPCDEYEQAFAWKHLVPARKFLFFGFPNGKPKAQNKKKGK